MPPLDQRCTAVAAFLNTAADLLRDDPEGLARVSQAMAELQGEPEPHLEPARQATLARWTTHRWAPAALRAAGFDLIAQALEQAIDPEAAAQAAVAMQHLLPEHNPARPQDLDQLALAATKYAVQTGFQMMYSIPPALAAKAARDAVQKALHNGQDVQRLDLAAECVNAARDAMAAPDPA